MNSNFYSLLDRLTQKKLNKQNLFVVVLTILLLASVIIQLMDGNPAFV